MVKAALEAYGFKPDPKVRAIPFLGPSGLDGTLKRLSS
jgi:hypothetical protein